MKLSKLSFVILCFVMLISFSCGSNSTRNCLTKDDCLAGEFCVDKQCDSVECRSNGDCLGTTFCISQRCRTNTTTSCTSDSDCNGGSCVLGSCSECVPRCTGNCGGDGCGGSCGTCQQGFTCNGDRCVQGCTPSCNGKSCGSDGCGGSCGTCNRGFKCGGAGNCELDPSAVWVLTVTNGKISESLDGDSWDFPGGLPDPRVCITINNDRNCTTTQDNTLSPVWNESFNATTAAIQTGLKVVIQDEDVTDFETICSEGLITLTEQNFKSGTFGASCKYGSFNATIRAK